VTGWSPIDWGIPTSACSVSPDPPDAWFELHGDYPLALLASH